MFLFTDFGTVDEFAGILRAVVVREAPDATVIDITHEIPPFDVRAGALLLERAVPHLGAGVVVAVVDPGVGTARSAVAVSVSVSSTSGPTHLVGPDNGVLSYALEALGGAKAAAALAPARWQAEAGATFDGRDVFAPAAARLWSGVPLEEVGSPIDPQELQHLPAPLTIVSQGKILTEVLWVDRFGNVQLSARKDDVLKAGVEEDLEVISDTKAHKARAASSFAVGDDLALIIDSNARLALVREQQSAATVLDVRAGDVLTLRSLGGSS